MQRKSLAICIALKAISILFRAVLINSNIMALQSLPTMAYNPDAMRALTSAVEAMKPKKSHVVISEASDRRDKDIFVS
ncbi:MAG TPA: hypothetical protein DCW35_00440 [Polynucleobacter sp.]|nr:hypothetical protein [Polynucleobacter sp.]